MKFIAPLGQGYSNPLTKLRCAETLGKFDFVQQVEMPMSYKGVNLDCGYCIDLIVGNLVVVELKAVPDILPVHEAQLLTYLRLTGLRVGLLINFNVAVRKDGIRRRIL